MTQKSSFRLLAQTTTVLALVSSAYAGGSTVVNSGAKAPLTQIQPKEESAFDKIWSLFSLYKNDSNPYLEELAIIGRYQGQYYSADGQNANDSDWENRRFRLGLKAKMLDKHLEFKGEMFSNLLDGEDFYAGLKNFNLSYKFSDAFGIMIGKFEPTFGYYYSKSDTLLVPFERNAITNQFKNEYSTGVNVFGKVDKFSYYVAANSNTPDKEFGDFNGGWSATVALSYDIKDLIHMDKALLHLDYLHSEHDAKDTVLTGFDNGVATYLELKQGAIGLTTEVMAGFGQSNVVGLTLEPTYDLTKQLQLVGRYQLAVSDEDLGITPNKRYESKVGAGKGDVYNAFYLGLNYFIYGDKLKLMAGAEYSTMGGSKGDDVLTLLAGVRAFW